MTQLTAVSLFAGVGGFDLAMERNGINVVAAVEIDKHARGVLEKQFPNTKLFNDVTEVTGEQLKSAGFIPERGIITGGFPCQDLSVAGKRAGLAWKRSGLYWEIIRLVDELAPAYIVLENVPGLLTSNRGRDMGAVIGALVDRRYGVSWRVLDAQNFGVPQRRRRVFIVGCAGDDGITSSEVLALSEGLRGDNSQNKKPRESIAGNTGTSIAESNIKLTAFGKTGFGKYTEGELTPLQASSHKRATENIVVTQGTTNATTVRRITPVECERLQGFPDNWTEGQPDGHRFKQTGNAIAVPVVEWIMARLVKQAK